MNYRPREDLVLVERIKEENKTETGILLPGEESSYILKKFKVISTGPNVGDLKEGDIVLAEDAFQGISKAEKNIGLINQKYIHLIYGK